jgi:hypothetical protein
MIDERERDISKSEMIAFFQSVPPQYKPSLGLMGGWAVNFLLEKRGVSHIGSRDIDIFFDPEKISQQSVVELIKSRGFSPHSTFRWVKFFHWETGKVISEEEAKKLQSYDQVRIFLDLAAPTKLDDHVLLEPLLSEVFLGNNEYWKSSNCNILMPSIRIMVRIKIKSTPERKDGFKRTKDLADLLAMLKSENGLWVISNGRRTALQNDLRDSHVEVLKDATKRYQVDGTLTDSCRGVGITFNEALTILQTL